MARSCLLALLICLLPAAARAGDPPAPAPAAPAPAAPAPAAPAPAAPKAAAPAPKAAAEIKAESKPEAKAEPKPEAKAEPKPIGVESFRGSDDLPTIAKLFYQAILGRNTQVLTQLCRPPFYFESKVANTAEDVRKRWVDSLSNVPLESLHLNGIEVLSPDEMTQKYGKQPEKLSGWPTKGGTLTVGNLSGHAAVVLWKKNNNAWTPLGFHD